MRLQFAAYAHVWSGETSTSGAGTPFGSGCEGGMSKKYESGAPSGASGALGTPWGSMANVRTLRAFVVFVAVRTRQLFIL